MKYEIIRRELRSNVKLCTQIIEDKELFKIIAKNEDYIILEDGKDVTKKYNPKRKKIKN